jgi:hypothetical protein
MRDLVDVRDNSVALDVYGLHSAWRWSRVEGEVRECFSKLTSTSNIQLLVSVSVGI